MAAVEALGTSPLKPTPRSGLTSTGFVKPQPQMKQVALSVSGAKLVKPYGSSSVCRGGRGERKSTLPLEASSW